MVDYSVNVNYNVSTEKREEVYLEIMKILSGKGLNFSAQEGLIGSHESQAIRVFVSKGHAQTGYSPMVEMGRFREAIDDLASFVNNL